MLKSGEKLRRLLMLLTTWGLLLAFFFAYEHYFVAGQREFLKEDGFRALTALSVALNAKVQKAQKSTDAFIKLVDPKNLPPKNLPPKDREKTLREFLRLYVTDEQISREKWKNIENCSRASIENSGQTPIEIKPGRDSLTLSISCQGRKEGHDLTQSQAPGLYTVDLVKGVNDAFEKQSRHFDDVLVADSSGNVIFQRSITGADPSLLKSSPKPRITNLRSLLTGSATAEPKKQDEDSAEKTNGSKKGPKGEAAVPGGKPTKTDGTANNAGKPQELDSGSERDEEFRRLLGASAFNKVTAAGKTYEMFSRPMPIPLSSGETWDLVMVGLWDAKQFEESSREIPYSTLIWAALIVVALLSLSWPLFKLRYMSYTERFSAIDGWFLVLALFLAATSIMLMLLNFSYIAHEQDKSDQSMENLANQIKINIHDEMVDAVSQLDKFPDYPSWKRSSKEFLGWDFLKDQKDYQPSDKNAFPYPYFESAAWVDKEGIQLFKFDIRSAPTPISKIGFRAYFKRAMSDQRPQAGLTGTLNGLGQSSSYIHDVEHHYLEPILSINTDEFEVDLSGLFQHYDGKTEVEILSLRPMSLVDPVLPPGYRFAVIDANCNVLFHSDSYRNMREDFCENSKDKDELRPWLFSGVDTPLEISYEGKQERAFLTSLESSPESRVKSPSFALETSTPSSNSTPVFLLVFREPDVDVTLNLAVVLVCSVLMGLYFVILLALALLYFLARGLGRWVYPPKILWPQPKHAVTYLQIFASNIVILLLFWWFYPQLYEAPLLALTAAVAFVSTLLSFSKLALPGWGIPVLPAKALSWVGLSSDFAERHFSKAYVLAVLSVITAAGLVPCIGSFKYSYDAIAELALKRDEIDVSERLIRRHDRINEYYKHVNLPEGAEGERALADRRSEDVLDRYDRAPVSSSGQPFRYDSAPVSSSGQPFFEVREVRKEDSASTPCDTGEEPLAKINDPIERMIAKATLAVTLPTNALGAQMSKLGVASSEDAKKNWEHSFVECSPTRFQLLWKETSRWQRETTVTATYPDWLGLLWWPCRILLLVLWVVLWFWLWILLKKIFLTELEDVTPFELLNWKAVADIRQNSLVIDQAESCRELRKEINGLPPGNRLDLRIELKEMVEKKSYWPRKLEKTGKILILDHFDFNMKDGNYNQARLRLLEGLLCKADVKLVIISTLDPLYFLIDDATEALDDGKDSALTRRLLLDRWASALSTFKKVQLKKVSDLVDSDYHVLWTGLSPTERLVLYQLARDGWANPKNLAAIQQLESKHLVHRDPMYRIFDESFLRFVLSPEHAEDMAQWDKLEQQSTWHAMRSVVIAIGIGVVVWLFYTQTAFSQTLVGYIAAIATLLTAAGSLFGRSGRPTPAKGEGE